MVKFTRKGGGEYTLDVTGYTCPYPVIYMKKALSQIKSGEVLEIIFDNPPSCETIPEAAKSDGHEVLRFERIGEGLWRILVRRK